MEMDVESKPTLVAFSEGDSYAGVCAGTNRAAAAFGVPIDNNKTAPCTINILCHNHYEYNL